MPAGKPGQAAHPSRRNLLRLCIIRIILTLVLAAIAAWFHYVSRAELPWNALMPLLAGMVAITLLVLLRLGFQWPVGEAEFFANLMLDITFLTLLLYHTGGSTNPLVSYYLIPLIISAAVLRPAFTWFIAVATMTLYTLLLFHFQPFTPFEMTAHHGGASAHFVGMWINFGFSALLISWFVVRMAQSLRENEKEISRARESDLRNEQIIGIANIAAGTAHELRTPLASMSILAGEMAEDHPQVREQAELLQHQVDRCDSILRELVSTATETGHKKSATAGSLFREVLDRWRLSRPEVRLETRLPDEVDGLQIVYDQSLVHALINFLNNAADVSPNSVVFRAEARPGGRTVRFLVEDRGPGIPPDLAGQLGKQRVSRKPRGLGLGSLLSQASIERLGGQVRMTNRPQGGTRLEISLTLTDTAPHA